MKKILDWKKYEETARQAIGEGCVLLENKNNALPLAANSTVSVFGRIQTNYYKSGTGSGGKVNVAKVYNIVEGLEENGIKINKELQKIYTDWEVKNPFDEGMGWGKERWSQEEMPLTEKIVSDAAAVSDTAIVILGRTAGEDKDNSATEGSYLLTKDEYDMLLKVRAGFKKVVVLLNVGNIIDMTFVDTCKPDAVMYVWQGGMLGGLGTADVLTGKTAPSGKLTDTVAFSISDYPSTPYFGALEGNAYVEDIYVGYRYFETFAKDKVRYPFGFGLTYSSFQIKAEKAENNAAAKTLDFTFKTTNTGKTAGKEVIQLYVQAPNGKLGKAARVLAGFDKTETLEAGKTGSNNISVPYYTFASYDDSGVTGHKDCWVLEEGGYTVYAGSDVRSAEAVLKFSLPELMVIRECEEALAPVDPFERMTCGADGSLVMQPAPLATVDPYERRLERIPAEIPQTNKTEYKLADVLNGKTTIENFVAQFTDDDLSCIVRGEGMGSSLVTAGTASAFGGVSPRLRDTFGIPAVCCDDGPSGMRLDCGIKAFALPNGTSLASSFNSKLVKELYSFTGTEMAASHVENLLGPGMNIHRNPLNGRNFEYFSEDPLLTGEIGSAMLMGLQSSGVTGTIKHFCGNNQEKNRHGTNSVISGRALREIYLKTFEIAVAHGADSVMTTYGLVNGLYTASSYDLTTTILRKDWGFKGIVMTDWWAQINVRGKPQDRSNFAQMVASQNDLYMCCSDGSRNADGDNTLEGLADGRVKRSELQRTAMNVCNHVMHTEAMRRLMNTADEIEVINRPANPDDINLEEVQFTNLGKNASFDLTYKESKANTNFILPLDVEFPGTYEITVTASSELNDLAQLPCTLFYQGIPIASFVFNGSQGKDVAITKVTKLINRFCVNRLFVASNGLKLKEISFKWLNDDRSFDF